MLKIFASGLMANAAFVGSGLLKQYLVASSLSVTGFGVYGSLVAMASLVLVLVPFPAYLNVMIRGFSAHSQAFGTRKQLILAAKQEFMLLGALAVAVALALGGYAALAGLPDERGWMLLLLLLVQYAMACVDLLLRMQQAHKQLAFFMMFRNLPIVALLLLVPAHSPLHVALLDFTAALITTGVFMRSAQLRTRMRRRIRWARWKLGGEQTVLWLARLVQFGNSSLLRLLVPLLYGANDTGLFFFALIAQLPCSLFLSVTTQLFGHTLARIRPGDWRTLWRTQGCFVLPNAGYALAAVLLLPFWDTAFQHLPKLAKYAQAGPLVLAVVIYSTVLASDCQEYLLRARGLSRVLLIFSSVSALMQAATVGIGALASMALQHTIYLCAASQALVLAGFSAYSFHRVMGLSTLETRP